MEGSVVDLSKYRFSKAQDNLSDQEFIQDIKQDAMVVYEQAR